jgi:hypothetical protein
MSEVQKDLQYVSPGKGQLKKIWHIRILSGFWCQSQCQCQLWPRPVELGLNTIAWGFRVIKQNYFFKTEHRKLFYALIFYLALLKSYQRFCILNFWIFFTVHWNKSIFQSVFVALAPCP